MTTIKNHIIVGHVNYAKVQVPGNKYKSEDREYSVDLILTPETAKELVDILSESGCMLEAFGKPRIKTLEDGTRIFKFKRPEFKQTGELNVIDVKVLGDHGGLEDLPKNILIGNGSKAAVHFITIETDSGASFERLTGLQVLDLVPYVPSSAPVGMKATSGGQSLSSMQKAVAEANVLVDSNEAPF